MYFSNHFHKSFINLAGNLKSSGSSADLAPGQLAFVNAKTFAVIPSGSASVATHPLVILAQGSLYKNDKLARHHGGYAESVKSRPINGRLITKFTKHAPNGEKPHILQLGYNGSIECACPQFESDTYYNFRIELKGSPVLRTYTRNLYRVFGVYTGLPKYTASSGYVDTKKVFEDIAAQIKADPEIAQFLKHVRVVSFGESNSTMTGVVFNTYEASRVDAGDILSYSEVVQNYPTAKLVNRVYQTSTYRIVTSGAAPSDNVGSTGLTWTKTQTAWKVKKKVCLSLPLKSGGASNLSDVQTAYASDAQFVSGSFAVYTENTTTSTTSTTTGYTGDSVQGCAETIVAEIYSDNIVDIDCGGYDLAEFSAPRSYNSYLWEDCPCEAAASVNTTRCAGLRLVAKTTEELSDKFSDSSYDQLDHVEVEPITILANFVNEFGETYTFKSMTVTDVQLPQIAQGLGEFARRELIKSSSYSQDFYLSDPRMREVLQYPYLEAIRPDKKYVVYIITHSIPTGIGQSGNIGQDRFLYKIFIEEGKSTDFETWMNAYLTSAGTGVALETL